MIVSVNMHKFEYVPFFSNFSFFYFLMRHLIDDKYCIIELIRRKEEENKD